MKPSGSILSVSPSRVAPVSNVLTLSSNVLTLSSNVLFSFFCPVRQRGQLSFPVGQSRFIGLSSPIQAHRKTTPRRQQPPTDRPALRPLEPEPLEATGRRRPRRDLGPETARHESRDPALAAAAPHQDRHRTLPSNRARRTRSRSLSRRPRRAGSRRGRKGTRLTSSQ